MKAKHQKPDQRIEPSRGMTYCHEGEFTVYEYDTYPRGSVLAGQTRRRRIEGGFTSVENAKAKYPQATIANGSGYQAPSLAHLPDADGSDPYGDNAEAARDNY